MTDLASNMSQQNISMSNDDDDHDDEYYYEKARSYFYFGCVRKGLTTLEGLVVPETVTTMDISCNKLTSLRGLPTHVRRVLAECNQITTLEGSHEGLEYIALAGNLLTNLIGCPKSIVELDCDRNKLTSLIGINEGCRKLHCQYNELGSFDYLPNSLHTVSLHSNPITTLKIIPSNMDILWTFHKVNLDVTEVPYSMEWLNQQGMTPFKISLYNFWTGLNVSSMPSKEDWEAAKKPLTPQQLVALNELANKPISSCY